MCKMQGFLCLCLFFVSQRQEPTREDADYHADEAEEHERRVGVVGHPDDDSLAYDEAQEGRATIDAWQEASHEEQSAKS